MKIFAPSSFATETGDESPKTGDGVFWGREGEFKLFSPLEKSQLRLNPSGFVLGFFIVAFGFDVAQQYNVRALDTTLIINEEGVIVYRDNGIAASKKTLEEAKDKISEEDKKKAEEKLKQKK